MTNRTPLEESRPRKTPSQARSRATIEAVLQASAHILEAGGLAAFNTNAVAERAGISIGSLYQYFPNKDAILVALIELQTAAFASTLAALLQTVSGASFVDDMRTLLEQAVEWHADRPQLSRILDDEERRLRPALDLCAAQGDMQTTFVQFLERRLEELGPIDVARVAADVTAVIRALMEAEGERADPDWPAAIDCTLAAITGYLSACRRPSLLSLTADAA